MLERLIERSFGGKTPNDQYKALLKYVDKTQPGYGLDVRDKINHSHWPSAYGLISSAEGRRHAYAQSEKDSMEAGTIALACTKWLLENIGCASTKAPCWGVPYARAIWEDEKPQKPGTAFAIPTVHAVQALCESVENLGDAFSDSEKKNMLNVAKDAITYFVEHCYDDTEQGVAFWYSPLEQHSFHVTNAISMVAGQAQRMQQLFPSERSLGERADRAVEYLLNCRRKDQQGYGWEYFGYKMPKDKKNRSNDLLHDAFVCHGLLDYKQHGGRYSHLISEEELYLCIRRFVRKKGIFEYPASESNARRRSMRARVIGIGHALYVVARIEDACGGGSLSDTIYKQFRKRYFRNDTLKERPDGDDVGQHVREVAHMLFGLSHHIWRSKSVHI